jgi:hypothetical protein
MAIALITSIRVPAALAAARKTWPLASGPLGRTGMMTDTARPGLATSRALMAWNRVALSPV